MGEELSRAVRQPGISKDDIVSFRLAAEAVKAGAKDADEAAREIAEISSAFAKILRYANNNAGALGVLIGLLTLITAYYAIYCSNAGSEQAHEDALLQLQASQTQMQAIESGRQAQMSAEQALKKIDAELQRLDSIGVSREEQRRPTRLTTNTYPRKKPAGAASLNRHERRKAASLARRQPPQ